ncbi:MAG: hypothetical protein ACPGJU_01585 [Coraliomargarita sp.]
MNDIVYTIIGIAVIVAAVYFKLKEDRSKAEKKPKTNLPHAHAPEANRDIKKDIHEASRWVSGALTSSGFKADYSLNSLKEIERFFEENIIESKPKPGGFLAEQFGSRIFAIGAYIGDVLIQHSNGHWEASDDDPKVEMNIKIVSQTGLEAWPVQKLLKRIKNGSEENIHHYGLAFIKHSEKESSNKAE